ncbi:MAG: putative Fe-S cluster assembly protein SufT [Verrucomicrobia bacterium]|nr:putative Fe-S cluster assembly protein SufT [Verrucomicrobiota bacterium]
MQNETTATSLRRECAAVRIPSGEVVTLAAGTEFDITQSLGGNHTLRTAQGLFQIAPKDADALGLAAEQGSVAPKTGPVADERAVWETLKSCFDPEIPVNIVDLGLVYDLVVEPLPNGNRRVNVKMTLTAPGCGMGTVIARDAQTKLLDLPGVQEAEVSIVWDPPWHQSMITADGRRVLGLE